MNDSYDNWNDLFTCIIKQSKNKENNYAITKLTNNAQLSLSNSFNLILFIQSKKLHLDNENIIIYKMCYRRSKKNMTGVLSNLLRTYIVIITIFWKEKKVLFFKQDIYTEWLFLFRLSWTCCIIIINLVYKTISITSNDHLALNRYI